MLRLQVTSVVRVHVVTTSVDKWIGVLEIAPLSTPRCGGSVMLLNIMRLPNLPMIPKNTSMRVSSSKNEKTNLGGTIYIDSDLVATFRVGNDFDRPLSDLYKTIHLSDNGKYAVETVSSCEYNLPLYSKVIGPNESSVCVGVAGINRIASTEGPVADLSHFIGDRFNYGAGLNHNVCLTPFVSNDESLVKYINESISDYQQVGGWSNWILKHEHLYTGFPNIFEAYSRGGWVNNPMRETITLNPYIQPKRPTYAIWDICVFRNEATRCAVIIDHKWFMSVCIEIFLSRPTSFTITALMGNVGDCTHWSFNVSDYSDIYLQQDDTSADADIRSKISYIFIMAMKTYCDNNRIDIGSFKTDGESSITIMKNEYDEVCVIIYDKVHDNHICYYSFMPNVLLGTLSVGWYFRE